MNTTDTGVKIKRMRVQRSLSGLPWRVLASLVLGGAVLYTVVPWAQAQRGNPAAGGEYLLVVAVAVLPFCFFRR